MIILDKRVDTCIFHILDLDLKLVGYVINIFEAQKTSQL